MLCATLAARRSSRRLHGTPKLQRRQRPKVTGASTMPPASVRMPNLRLARISLRKGYISFVISLEKGRNFAEISQNFEISCARICALVFNSPISLTRFPSQNEVPRFVPL